MRLSKWMTLAAALAAGACLLQYGCLNSFWQGFAHGWPGHSRWLNLANDVVNEVLLG